MGPLPSNHPRCHVFQLPPWESDFPQEADNLRRVYLHTTSLRIVHPNKPQSEYTTRGHTHPLATVTSANTPTGPSARSEQLNIPWFRFTEGFIHSALRGGHSAHERRSLVDLSEQQRRCGVWTCCNQSCRGRFFPHSFDHSYIFCARLVRRPAPQNLNGPA